MSQTEESGLAPSDRKNIVTEVVMYLLSQEASKIPAKRISIIKSVLTHHSKSFRTIMVEAKDVLAQVFGYQLLESDGRYFMVNKYESSELGLKILREPSEHRKRCCLLMLVLSLIFMEGGAVRDDVVWEFLKRLNIKLDGPDPVFGEVKKVLTKDYVHMLYLRHLRREGTDPPLFEFSSGPRADAEITKRKLLEFVAKVYGNHEHDWPLHMKQLEQIESAEGQRLSQLLSKRMRLSQPSSSQPSSSQPSSSQLSSSELSSPQPSTSQSSSSQPSSSHPTPSQPSSRPSSSRPSSSRLSASQPSSSRPSSSQPGRSRR